MPGTGCRINPGFRLACLNRGSRLFNPLIHIPGNWLVQLCPRRVLVQKDRPAIRFPLIPPDSVPPRLKGSWACVGSPIMESTKIVNKLRNTPDAQHDLHRHSRRPVHRDADLLKNTVYPIPDKGDRAPLKAYVTSSRRWGRTSAFSPAGFCG